MKNYTALNIPTDLLNDITTLCKTLLADAESGKQEIINQGSIFRIRIHKGGKAICDNPEHNKLYDSIQSRIPESILKITTGAMMLNLKHGRFQKVHIDRDRECALNIPVVIPAGTHLGVYRHELNNTIDPKWLTMHPNDQNPTFDLDDEGEKYELGKPVILNTRSWHWVDHNYDATKPIRKLSNGIFENVRSILSYDINYTPYEETIEIFRDAGWL